MFTIKLIKYEPNDSVNGTSVPVSTKSVSIREATAVHLIIEKDGRQVLQLGDAPGETMELTVGDRDDCSYTVAYIMNASGKTVETVR